MCIFSLLFHVEIRVRCSKVIPGPLCSSFDNYFLEIRLEGKVHFPLPLLWILISPIYNLKPCIEGAILSSLTTDTPMYMTHSIGKITVDPETRNGMWWISYEGPNSRLFTWVVQINQNIWVKSRLLPILFQRVWFRKYGDDTNDWYPFTSTGIKSWLTISL